MKLTEQDVEWTYAEAPIQGSLYKLWAVTGHFDHMRITEIGERRACRARILAQFQDTLGPPETEGLTSPETVGPKRSWPEIRDWWMKSQHYNSIEREIQDRYRQIQDRYEKAKGSYKAKAMNPEEQAKKELDAFYGVPAPVIKPAINYDDWLWDGIGDFVRDNEFDDFNPHRAWVLYANERFMGRDAVDIYDLYDIDVSAGPPPVCDDPLLDGSGVDVALLQKAADWMKRIANFEWAKQHEGDAYWNEVYDGIRRIIRQFDVDADMGAKDRYIIADDAVKSEDENGLLLRKWYGVDADADND